MFDFQETRRASRPLPAQGIKAISRTGKFGTHWWANRLALLVENEISGIVRSLGKNYARRGQVLWFTVHQGHATGQVQGSEQSPYRTKLTFKTLEKQQCSWAEEVLLSYPTRFAELLQGEFTEALHEQLLARGCNLFSEHVIADSDCTCGEWDDICKHAAAVEYLLIEQCDQSPLDLFMLRGVDCEKLLTQNSLVSKFSADEPANMWNVRPELALRSALGEGSAATMEFLRHAYNAMKNPLQ